MIGAIDQSGLIASFAVRGTTDTAAMVVFLTEILLPELQPGDCIVWDNLWVHKTLAVRRMFEKAEIVFAAPFIGFKSNRNVLVETENQFAVSRGKKLRKTIGSKRYGNHRDYLKGCSELDETLRLYIAFTLDLL